ADLRWLGLRRWRPDLETRDIRPRAAIAIFADTGDSPRIVSGLQLQLGPGTDHCGIVQQQACITITAGFAHLQMIARRFRRSRPFEAHQPCRRLAVGPGHRHERRLRSRLECEAMLGIQAFDAIDIHTPHTQHVLAVIQVGNPGLA
ncbi:hypothetical protein RZS08_14645, partial [Arthrospira platensis SPKY1]|nr:hypothetical protein [Arthrospira platensis SPKY1]